MRNVVEYALNRAMSPALVSEYRTQLPDKKLLQAELHAFYQLAESQARQDADAAPSPKPVAKVPAKRIPRKKGRKK